MGITKRNADMCCQGRLRGAGDVNYDVPDHWEYAAVFATLHEWDLFYADAVYSAFFDVLSRERIIGGRLEAFIQELGCPARAHGSSGHKYCIRFCLPDF
jgi:hypothetical protein